MEFQVEVVQKNNIVTTGSKLERSKNWGKHISEPITVE